MSGFYVSLIFVGIMLVIISLILILIDKKDVFLFRKTIDDKKQELAEIISDAEQMIDELNRFSDYIVNQMDLKNDELNRNLKAAEQKIDALTTKKNVAAEYTGSEKSEYSDESSKIRAASEPSAQKDIHGDQDKETAISAAPAAAVKSAGIVAEAYSKNGIKASHAKKRDKVIPFTNRYSEVLRLSKEGMEELDIAKNLNMGKGEVELIIGLRR